MNKYLEKLAKNLLGIDFEKLSARKKKVLEHIAEGEFIVEDVNRVYAEELTFGEKFADKIARFGGSWSFLLTAISFLMLWMLFNSGVVSKFIFGMEKPFDGYPFILLNLMLSMLAALQAPVIMMSQNRQVEKDRIAANINYESTLKMELEITRLHHRLDEMSEAMESMQRILEETRVKGEDEANKI